MLGFIFLSFFFFCKLVPDLCRCHFQYSNAKIIKLFSLNKTRVICEFHHLRCFVLIRFAREEASFPFLLYLFVHRKILRSKRIVTCPNSSLAFLAPWMLYSFLYH